MSSITPTSVHAHVARATSPPPFPPPPARKVKTIQMGVGELFDAWVWDCCLDMGWELNRELLKLRFRGSTGRMPNGRDEGPQASLLRKYFGLTGACSACVWVGERECG